MISTHSVSVSAVITNANNEILLIDGLKRGWEIPGGLVEHNESLKSALEREIHEETGAYINNIVYKGLFHNLNTNTFNLLFTGNYSHGNLHHNDECRSVGFFPKDKVREMVVWSNFMDRINLSLTSENFIVEFDETHSIPLETVSFRVL
jgi:ADP-ribose pyrophosphatase YjhB (NUDIX family)